MVVLSCRRGCGGLFPAGDGLVAAGWVGAGRLWRGLGGLSAGVFVLVGGLWGLGFSMFALGVRCGRIMGGWNGGERVLGCR